MNRRLSRILPCVLCRVLPPLGVTAALMAGIAAPLAWAQSSPSAASPAPLAPLAPVEVRAGEALPARQGASVGGLSDAPLAETPQTVSVIRAEALREAGANSLSSAVRSEPSASDFYNTLGYIESLQVRGFLLNNALNFRRDGLPISNHAPFALENKSSIEILKGLSGIQAGLSAPGGLVNFTVKRPTAQPLREVVAGLSERGSTLLHGDLGGRAGADGAFGYRINAALEERRPEVRNAPGGREFLSGFFDQRPQQFFGDFNPLTVAKRP